ncbi:MAG: folate-binding protein YgfZ [Labilithrix sp.]|nr:folate-binding protein YgfZ [Labilithrix sp.]
MNAPYEREGRAAAESVLVVSEPSRAGIVVRGRDRLSWLNGLLTCELAKLDPGEGAYGLLVEKKGRIQTDLYLAPAEGADPSVVLGVPRDLRDALVATLDHYLIMEDAELVPVELSFFIAHGPRAAELGGVVRDRAGAFAGTVRLLPAGGLVIAVPVAEKAEIEARLAEEAARLGGAFASDEAWEAVRVEQGLPRFGVEVDATLYPQEASLEKLAVSFSKGCYLGQEVVYMLENRGHVKRKLVPVDIEGAVPARGAAVTTPAGEAVGEIKSAVTGPVSGKAVGIAMVKWAHAKPSTELRVGADAATVRA